MSCHHHMLRETTVASGDYEGVSQYPGSISQTDRTPKGPANIGTAVSKRLRLQGFIVSDHLKEMGVFVDQMRGWIASRQMKWRETVDQGIERAPEALLKLFSGQNFGKMLMELA